MSPCTHYSLRNKTSFEPFKYFENFRVQVVGLLISKIWYLFLTVDLTATPTLLPWRYTIRKLTVSWVNLPSLNNFFGLSLNINITVEKVASSIFSSCTTRFWLSLEVQQRQLGTLILADIPSEIDWRLLLLVFVLGSARHTLINGGNLHGCCQCKPKCDD